jgi:hypothetical protein
MTIVNRRNAVVGWAMLKLWKHKGRRKAKQARGQVGGLRKKSN